MRKLRELLQQQKATRNDRGFNMLELIMVVVVIGILGGIGFAIYRGVSDNARGTVLDANIATAAEELNAVLEVNPLAANSADELAAAMTDRTNFVWESQWNYEDDDGPDVIRFEFLKRATSLSDVKQPDDTTTPVTPPAVRWITSTDGAAIRIHARNSEEQWRCALLIRHVSKDWLNTNGSNIFVFQDGAVGASPPGSALIAAEIGGSWFDGGNKVVAKGLNDCSPVAEVDGGSECNDSSANKTVTDACVPDSANTWNLGDDDAKVDDTSSTTADVRTLHGSIGQLDGPS